MAHGIRYAIGAIVCTCAFVVVISSAGISYMPALKLPLITMGASDGVGGCGRGHYFSVWDWCAHIRNTSKPDALFERALRDTLDEARVRLPVGNCTAGFHGCAGSELKGARDAPTILAMAGVIDAARRNLTAHAAVSFVARVLEVVPWRAELTRLDVARMVAAQSPFYGVEACGADAL